MISSIKSYKLPPSLAWQAGVALRTGQSTSRLYFRTALTPFFWVVGMEIPQLSLMLNQSGAPHYAAGNEDMRYAQMFASVHGAAAEHMFTGLLPDAHGLGQLIMAEGSAQEVKPVVRRSKYRGLTWDKKERRWRVRINVMGKQHHVGR